MPSSIASDLIAPRHLWRPTEEANYGPKVAAWAAQIGLPLDPEQRLVLNLMYARRGGRWAAMEVGVIAPRQQGKTYALEVACLADLFLFGGADSLIIWTAHLFPTANEAFIDIKAMIEARPYLASRVARITEAAGNQGVQLVDGARLKFLARSKGGGRGFSGTKIYLDEAFALDPAEVGALLPTLSAQPDPQVVYGSSAGGLKAAVLRGLRDRGRKGDDPRLAYVEWAAREDRCTADDCLHRVGTPGCVLDDEARWVEANTGIARGRTDVEFISTERRSLPAQEFMRERLGWWEDPPDGSDDDSPLANWPNLAEPAAAPVGSIVLGIDAAPDLVWASIVAYGEGPAGEAVERVERKRGTGWLPARLAELLAKHEVRSWGLVDGSPAASLLPDLPEGGVLLKGPEYRAACQSWATAVTDGTVHHRGDPELDASMAAAARKFVGDGWQWTRRGSDQDISLTVAATVARHLWVTGDHVDRSTEALLRSLGLDGEALEKALAEAQDE